MRRSGANGGCAMTRTPLARASVPRCLDVQSRFSFLQEFLRINSSFPDDGAERVDAVALHAGLLFISRFRELRVEKGIQLSPELRFVLAFVAPKVQVGMGASLVSARGLSRILYTAVQDYCAAPA